MTQKLPEGLLNAVHSECQRVLDEVPTDGAPTSMYLELWQSDWSYPTAPVPERAWLVTRSAVKEIPVEQPVDRDSNGTRKRYFDVGRGHFSFTSDLQKTTIGWQIGPLYGLGSEYEVSRTSTGEFELKNPKRLWVS